MGRWDLGSGGRGGWVLSPYLHRRANGVHKISVDEVEKAELLYPLNAMSKTPSVCENILDLLKNASKYEREKPNTAKLHWTNL